MPGKEGNIAKHLLSTTGILILLASLILLNVIFSFVRLRWDITQENLYSLTKNTKEIVKDLKEPVVFKVFFSRSNERIPIPVKDYAKKVVEILKEYESVSKGKVRVEEYDPKEDSDEEDWAAKYGIEARTTGDGNRVYFGMVAVAAEREEVIPFLDQAREQLLEYDITRTIMTLQENKKKTIGILSSLPVFGVQNQPNVPPGTPGTEPWFFVSELKKTYEVKQISPNATEIDPTLDLLLVVYPKRLGYRTAYALDQFVLSGKNAVIYQDPMCLNDPEARPSQARELQTSELDRVFAGWGFNMVAGKAVADLKQATQVRNQFNFVEFNPTWITAREKALNTKSILTANLNSMLFPVAGAFEKGDKYKGEWEILINSTAQSGLVEAFTATLGERMIQEEFKDGGKELALAVRANGKFGSAFPEGPPHDPESPDAPVDKSRHIAAAAKESTVILVGDCDGLADDSYMIKQNYMGFLRMGLFNDNLTFLLNACELLTSGDALIGIRSRGKFDRPFTKVLDIQAKAKEKWMERESELMKKEEEATAKLRQLEQQKDASQRMIITPEQQKEIQAFKDQSTAIAKELRDVRKRLREDVDRLGMWLKFINIFLTAFLVAAFGVAFGLYRTRRSRPGRSGGKGGDAS